MKILLIIAAAWLMTLGADAQTLRYGGQFKDLILPMQGTKTAVQKIWGFEKVQDRWIDNGAEPISNTEGKPLLSYWGGNIVKDNDGLYHLFVAGWDAAKNGHNYWPQSDIYHLTSDNCWGPYSLTSDYNIGKGHNPEVFRAKDGTYVMYVLRNNSWVTTFQSSSLHGSWTETPLAFDFRDRTPLTPGSSYSNFTFCSRPDGSVLALGRTGTVWVSRDGKSPFVQISDVCVYPQGVKGAFEDPVIWFDGYQYHHIVNDWRGCKAYYSRSFDGVHWTYEPGIAYDPSVSVHPDGTRETWWKYERPRIFQDAEGRAIQLNMAVIDVKKTARDTRTDGADWTTVYDAADDTHSSKNITMPLIPGLLLEVLNADRISASTGDIKVLVIKEKGFNPATDLDISSLRFGSYAVVNNGQGAEVISSEEQDGNLVLTFHGANTGIAADEFAPKMIGRYAADYVNPSTPTAGKGGVCFGYARLPYLTHPFVLSPRIPTIGAGGVCKDISIENYGVTASPDEVQIRILADTALVAKGTVTSLKPYEHQMVALHAVKAIPAGTTQLTIALYEGDTKIDETKLAVADAMAAQDDALASSISEGNALDNNVSYAHGKAKLHAAMASGKTVLFAGDSVTDGGWGNSAGHSTPSAKRNHGDQNHIYGHSYMMLCAAHFQCYKPENKDVFYNRGISGDDITRLEARWQEDVVQLNPDIVSLLIGTNDVLYYLDNRTGDFDFAQWGRRYRTLLDSVRTANPDVKFVLCTPFVAKVGKIGVRPDYGVREEMITRLSDIISDIAKNYDAILIRYDKMFALQASLHPEVSMEHWIWDGIHPTAAGHRLMADQWIKACEGVLE